MPFPGFSDERQSLRRCVREQCLKFGELANYLIKGKIVKKFHTPYPCSDETLKRAHSESYIKNVKNKTLDENIIKK